MNPDRDASFTDGWFEGVRDALAAIRQDGVRSVEDARARLERLLTPPGDPAEEAGPLSVHDPDVLRAIALAAERGEGPLRLVLQLLGVPACEVCGYVRTGCWCPTVTVDTIAALEWSGIDGGEVARVRSTEDLWRHARASRAPADGVDVVNAVSSLGGSTSGRWLRKPDRPQ